MPTFYSHSLGREVAFNEVNEVHLVNSAKSGRANMAEVAEYLRSRLTMIGNEKTLRVVCEFLNPPVVSTN